MTQTSMVAGSTDCGEAQLVAHPPASDFNDALATILLEVAIENMPE